MQAPSPSAPHRRLICVDSAIRANANEHANLTSRILVNSKLLNREFTTTTLLRKLLANNVRTRIYLTIYKNVLAISMELFNAD